MMGYKLSDFLQQRDGEGELHSGANALPLHSRSGAVICCATLLSWTNVSYCQTWVRKCSQIRKHRGERAETWDSFQVQFLSIRREKERKVRKKRNAPWTSPEGDVSRSLRCGGRGVRGRVETGKLVRAGNVYHFVRPRVRQKQSKQLCCQTHGHGEGAPLCHHL